jgi:hypothetical protein
LIVGAGENDRRTAQNVDKRTAELIVTIALHQCSFLTIILRSLVRRAASSLTVTEVLVELAGLTVQTSNEMKCTEIRPISTKKINKELSNSLEMTTTGGC